MKLRDLDPALVASEVTRLVREHLVRQCMRLGITEPLPQALVPELDLAVAELTRYAQEGAPHCGDAEPSDYLQTVVEALYTSAHPDAYAQTRTALSIHTGELERACDVVLCAAACRIAITAGEPVPLRWLSALSGLGLARTRNVASAGELATVTEGRTQRVEAAEARRWLSGRGIAVD